MERTSPWNLEDMMNGKKVIKFQMEDGRWGSLVPDDMGAYNLFVEPFSKRPDEKLTPDQIADRTMQRRADRISHRKGIPDMGLPPVETSVDPQQTLADMKRLEKIPDVKIRRRPKHGRA